MKPTPQILTALFISVLAAFAGCGGGSTVSEYGYVFQESTGQNQYIVLQDKKVPITFVVDDSNPNALKSLRALKPGVLYANAAGDRIFVSGKYDPQSQSFRLSHWYIKVPFERLIVKDDTQIPHNVQKVQSQSLERTDFEAKDGFDPNNPAFDPKSFQRTQ